MREQNNFSSETTLQKFLKYFTLVITLLYPIVGLFLYFSRPDQIAMVDQNTKRIVGIILILYGIFRFFRAYRRSSGHKSGPDLE